MPGLEDLYREIILDHYRNPRNRGELPTPPAYSETGFNPLCGDEITLYLQLDGDRLADVKLTGQGCSISQSSASMMSTAVKGKSLAEARATIRKFKSMMSIHEQRLDGPGDGDASDDGDRCRCDGGSEPAPEVSLGDLEALQGVVKFPVRIKCATLSWNTLVQALDHLESEQVSLLRSPCCRAGSRAASAGSAGVLDLVAPRSRAASRTASTWAKARRSSPIHSFSLSPTRRTHQARASLRLRATPASIKVSSTRRSGRRSRVITGTEAVVKTTTTSPTRAPHDTLRPKAFSAAWASAMRSSRLLPGSGASRRDPRRSRRRHPASGHRGRGRGEVDDHQDLVLVGDDLQARAFQWSGIRSANHSWIPALIPPWWHGPGLQWR